MVGRWQKVIHFEYTDGFIKLDFNISFNFYLVHIATTSNQTNERASQAFS